MVVDIGTMAIMVATFALFAGAVLVKGLMAELAEIKEMLKEQGGKLSRP